MLGFFGTYYVEVVIIAMSVFAAGLFWVSVTDALHRGKGPEQD